jgi:signal transduction histidine kinase
MVAFSSLRFRIAIAIFAIGSVMMMAVLAYVLHSMTREMHQQSHQQEEVLADLLVGLSRPSLLTNDYSSLQPYMENLADNPLIHQVILLDHRERVVAASRIQDLGQPITQLNNYGERYWRQYPIVNPAETLGILAIAFSRTYIDQAEAQAFRTGMLLSLSAMGIFALLGLIFAFGLTRRLENLAKLAIAMAEGSWKSRSGYHGRDEVSRLGMAFDSMAARIEKDQHDLQQTNASLEQRVAERTAALEAANQELESFSYSVSHDLRAPLRGIDGFSQALLEDYRAQLDETAQDYLQRICRGAARMGELIDNLLLLSHLNQVQPNFRKVDLSRLARETARTLQEREPLRQVRLEIEDGIQVDGDEGLLRIVLENLLGNAWKYTSRTEQAIISFRQLSNPDGRVQYCVADNGSGFDMAHADKLFAPFQRLHRQDEFEGNGIGLATVQRIIHRHGGSIDAMAEPGTGARFCFSLATTVTEKSPDSGEAES